VPALERLRGVHVVADPAALDAAGWQGDAVTVLRLAPDEALAFGASGVELDDEHAIIESEVGFAGAWLPLDDVLPHVEWPLPTGRPALAQGSIAGVPAKLWLPAGVADAGPDADVLLVAAAA